MGKRTTVAVSQAAIGEAVNLEPARWTSVLAVSHTTSKTASFGSIRNECCRTDRKGISCGVSTTCRRMDGQRPSERLSQLHPVLKK